MLLARVSIERGSLVLQCRELALAATERLVFGGRFFKGGLRFLWYRRVGLRLERMLLGIVEHTRCALVLLRQHLAVSLAATDVGAIAGVPC